jgi:hypothetical protein
MNACMSYCSDFVRGIVNGSRTTTFTATTAFLIFVEDG